MAYITVWSWLLLPCFLIHFTVDPNLVKSKIHFHTQICVGTLDVPYINDIRYLITFTANEFNNKRYSKKASDQNGLYSMSLNRDKHYFCDASEPLNRSIFFC